MKKIFLFVCLFIATLNKAYSQQLPTFSYLTTSGDTINDKFLSGKAVYINIWETYCGPCIDEIPVLNALKQKHPNIIFLAITPATKSKTLKFLKAHPFSFPVIYEAKDLAAKLIKGGYPTHVFINKSGEMKSLLGRAEATLNYNNSSRPSKKEIKKEIKRLLNDDNYKKLDASLSEIE